MRRQSLEDPVGGEAIRRGNLGEDRRHGGLHCAAALAVGPGALGRKAQHGAPPIAGIGDTHQDSLGDGAVA
jgi:hypothetical protein